MSAGDGATRPIYMNRRDWRAPALQANPKRLAFGLLLIMLRTLVIVSMVQPRGAGCNLLIILARVAELADALDSGSSE